MRPDVEVLQSGSVGQGEAERGFESALSPSGFEDVGDGAGAEGVAFEGYVDGGGQLLRPVVVEQGEQPGGVRSQRLSAFGEPLEERGGGGDGGAKAVAGGVGVGLAGGREQAFQMRGVFNGQRGIVGAVMVGQLGLSVEDADAGGAGRPGSAAFGRGCGESSRDFEFFLIGPSAQALSRPFGLGPQLLQVLSVLDPLPVCHEPIRGAGTGDREYGEFLSWRRRNTRCPAPGASLLLSWRARRPPAGSRVTAPPVAVAGSH